MAPYRGHPLVLHKFTRLINNVEPFSFYSNGTIKRDYTFYSDIVDGIISSLRLENIFEIIILEIQNGLTSMNISINNSSKTKYRSSVFQARLITANISLPNILSLSRIFCIPLIAFCIIHFHEYNNYRYIALFIMFGAGLSDLLDGYLARKRNETTRLGIYLDSIADKLLLISVFILLSCDNLWPEPRFPNWIPVIVIAKEIVITIGSLGVTYFTGKTPGPSLLGKISTDLQICAIIALLLGNHIPLNVIVTFFWLAVIFACISMVHYICRGLNEVLMTKRL